MTTDGLREMPSGWTYTQIGAVAPVNPSTTFEGLEDEAEVVFVPMAAVSEESGAIDITGRRTVREVSKGFVRFRGGDVIFAKITPCMENGKIAAVPNVGLQFAGSTEFQVLRPSAAIDQRYLWYFLVQRSFRAQAQRNMGGSAGQMRVPTTFLRDASIPLPPLAEQKRIVARIDELFAEIAEGEAALTRARERLETFRRALLKSAVTGELTRDWRESSKSVEAAETVLARIAGKTAGASKRRGRSTISAEVDFTTLPELPTSWLWSTLGTLGEIVGGATVDKKRSPADPVLVPYLRVANVQRGHLALDQIKHIVVERAAADRLRLQPGDILLNEGGDRDKIGRGWVWNGEIEHAIHQNHVFRVRTYDCGIKPEFVSHYANEMGRRFFIEEGKQTTNLASISMSKIACLPVPVPPPEETVEILRRASDALAAHTDTLTLIDAEAADATRLRQAVLKAAFEGHLVPQDPDEEPASAMLERLANADPRPKTNKRGRPRKT